MNSTRSLPALAKPGPISRLNVVLAVILVLQLMVAAAVYWPRDAASSGAGPILGDLTAAAVTGLSITDNTGATLAFSRSQDGWTLDGSDGYPARASAIDEVIDKLLAVQTDRQVTRTAGSHARLQVAEQTFQRRIDLTTASGVQTLLLGSSAGAAATHVRALDQDAVYLTGAIGAWELTTTPGNWIDTAYFRVELEDIRAITIENPANTLVLIPDGDLWTLGDLADGEVPLPANIRTLATRIAALSMTRPLGTQPAPEYGLEQPETTVTVTVADAQGQEQTHTILIGDKDPESNSYVAKASNSDYYVALAAFAGDEIVQKTRADLLDPAASTVPAAAPSTD